MSERNCILPSGLDVDIRKWKLMEIRELSRSKKKNFQKKIKAIIENSIECVNHHGPYDVLGAYEDGVLNFGKILENDWTPLLFLSRAKTHGPNYSVRTRCPDCNTVNIVDVNIIEDFIVNNLFDEDNEKMAVTREAILSGKREIIVPIEGLGEATIRFLTIEEAFAFNDSLGDDEEATGDYAYLKKKVVKFVSSQNGVTYSNETVEGYIPIYKWLEAMDEDVACAIVSEIDEYEFGINLVVEAECKACNGDFDHGVDLSSNFYRPHKQKKKNSKTQKRGFAASRTKRK